jgi:hypothetical protein
LIAGQAEEREATPRQGREDLEEEAMSERRGWPTATSVTSRA